MIPPCALCTSTRHFNEVQWRSLEVIYIFILGLKCCRFIYLDRNVSSCRTSFVTSKLKSCESEAAGSLLNTSCKIKIVVSCSSFILRLFPVFISYLFGTFWSVAARSHTSKTSLTCWSLSSCRSNSIDYWLISGFWMLLSESHRSDLTETPVTTPTSDVTVYWHNLQYAVTSLQQQQDVESLNDQDWIHWLKSKILESSTFGVFK